MLERDALVPTMPVLTATERTRHPRVTTPQEIKDALHGLSYNSQRLPDGDGLPALRSGTDLLEGKHLASPASTYLM